MAPEQGHETSWKRLNIRVKGEERLGLVLPSLMMPDSIPRDPGSITYCRKKVKHFENKENFSIAKLYLLLVSIPTENS